MNMDTFLISILFSVFCNHFSLSLRWRSLFLLVEWCYTMLGVCIFRYNNYLIKGETSIETQVPVGDIFNKSCL